ncbi:serine/threonine protein kinase [Methylomonas sp. LL1]|uniref:serine/threonine-protein kinase n=1 Tax=Methylomonas sp. LL1 TaxID=2785785 RepID=UPI0018C39983|nr:serine/threonine-protein kinase [Methylomonas sp. LL1]QPK63466.1 serine/threonine protein kinase [Methylomonas sp. LL1]
MNAFDTALKAFQQSQIPFDELARVARQTGLAPEAMSNAARQLLEAEYRAGRIPPQVYSALEGELSDKTQISQPFDSATVLPPSANQDDATRIQPAASNPSPALAQTLTPTSSPTSPPMNTESLLKGLREQHPHRELTVGSILKNRFELQQLLGVGGMGMVFKATDLRKIEAQDKDPFVALKVLNQDFQANPMALVSLQRETKRAQTLSHPNIIKVYDFDRDGGHVFMSMEYLEGQPLSHLIKENPDGLPFKQAWPIIHAMADALRHAHKKNIVHSDFKPGNVFIDINGEVRVLDFGIACAISRSDKDHQDATIFNARSLGAFTPSYASLEQLHHSDPDQRDDIYALACVSYELLSGKHPFGRLSAEKALEVNLQAKPIPKLSRRQWKGLQKALAFQQTQRTPTVDKFLAALGPRSAVFYGLWGTGVLATGLFAANIYLSMIAPPTVVEAPKVAIQLSAEQQQKIKDLLELASIHADVGYLTAPTGSNALWAYQEILKIDPYNKSATQGIIKIADTLEQQAWEAYERNDRSAALKKVLEGLEAHPAHKGLLSLREKLRASQ